MRQAESSFLECAEYTLVQMEIPETRNNSSEIDRLSHVFMFNVLHQILPFLNSTTLPIFSLKLRFLNILEG